MEWPVQRRKQGRRDSAPAKLELPRAMNSTSSTTALTYQEEIASATETARERHQQEKARKQLDTGTQKLILVAGSGLAVGAGLLILNRLGLFHPGDLAHRILNREALYSAGHRLAALPRGLGEQMGLVERKPRTLKHRVNAWVGTAAGTLDQARHRVGGASSHAFESIRGGLHDTRVRSIHLAKEHPATTVGAGLLTLGLLAAAFVAPSFLRGSSSHG